MRTHKSNFNNSMRSLCKNASSPSNANWNHRIKDGEEFKQAVVPRSDWASLESPNGIIWLNQLKIKDNASFIIRL